MACYDSPPCNHLPVLSFDGINHLASGIWHQEQPADRIEFPYVLVKVHLPTTPGSDAIRDLPDWMKPLVEQGLMTEVMMGIDDDRDYSLGTAGG